MGMVYLPIIWLCFSGKGWESWKYTIHRSCNWIFHLHLAYIIFAIIEVSKRSRPVPLRVVFCGMSRRYQTLAKRWELVSLVSTCHPCLTGPEFGNDRPKDHLGPCNGRGPEPVFCRGIGSWKSPVLRCQDTYSRVGEITPLIRPPLIPTFQRSKHPKLPTLVYFIVMQIQTLPFWTAQMIL